MKKIVLIVTAIFTVFLFTACSVTLPPDKVVEKMFQAVHDGDGKSFMECWDTDSNIYSVAKRMDDKGKLTDTKDIYSLMGLDILVKFEVLSVRVDEIDETNAKVTAELSMTAPIGGTMETPAEFDLISKDGKWYITD